MSLSLKSNTAKVVAGFLGVAVVLAALAMVLTVAVVHADSYTFTANLKVGSTGVDVMNLQKVLNMSADTQVSASGAGSPGNESTYFGSKTKAAVIKFQEKYKADILTPVGLTSGTGFVGASTRAKLNSMGSTTNPPTTTNPPATSGKNLSVSMPAQPTASLAPESAARVPFTKVTLTAGTDGDITVNNLTIERGGLAQDAVFAGVVLLDENGQQIGIAKTLNSNHQAIVGDSFVVKAGTSRTITVAGNMSSSLDSYAGQVVSLRVVGVNSSATVNGSLPIEGAFNTINATLSLGSATLAVSSFDPNTNQTKQVGDTNIAFAGIRVTAGSAEKVYLKSIRWNQSGSASSNDLANVKVYVDGVAYDTTISSDGKYYTAMLGSGILIDKGLSKDVYVKGDVVGSGAAGRTIKFDINKNTDIYLVGETYGYGVTPTAGSTGSASDNSSEFTTSTPFFDASKLTINAGSFTSITKATEVAAQNIAVNVPNQVLGGFKTDIKGEAISVQSLAFTIATSSEFTGASGVITNISIVNENGAVVAGPIDEASTCTTGCTITFTDTITFPVGIHVYTLKGKIPTGVSNGATVVVSATPSSGWSNVTGQTTGNTISLSSNGAFSMNTMTVRAAALAITVSASPVAQNIVAGGTQVLFANYQLDATQSGEDVRFSSIPLLMAGTGTRTKLTSCQLYDGTTVLNSGSNVVNPVVANTSETFTFDSALTVTKGTVKTLALKCNVASDASGTFIWGIASSPSITVTGVTSSSDVSESVTASAGQTMTVSSGSLTVSSDASTPSYSVVAAGSTGVTAGVLKFRATNEAVNLTKVALQLTNSASSSASDLVQVSLWDGATQVGTLTFTGANTIATSTLNSVVSLPKDSDKILTIKADLAQIGSSLSGTQGHLIALDLNDAEGTGAQSGTTINASINSSNTTSFPGIRVFKSYPTLALGSLPSSGVADGRLLRFTVTANSNGDVGIEKFQVSLATSSANVTNINLFGYTDSSYSTPIAGVSTGGQIAASNFCSSGCTSSSPTLNIYAQTSAPASTTIQVPAGQTRYFELRGSVSGSATNYSVTATLVGDSAYPNNVLFGTVATSSAFMASTTGIDRAGATSRSFIWSPNATGTSGLTANDWTNGFSLPGLPSNGIIQTRSN